MIASAPPRWRALVVVGWAVVAASLLVAAIPAIRVLHLVDTDDALRLVEVRDLLAGQGWFDPVQHRIDPPHGVVMHWSRLVDAPLAALILALRPLFGAALAEKATLVAVPLLTLLTAMAAAGRLAARLAGPAAVLAMAGLWLVSSTLLAQFQPLRIDHHGWQVVALLIAANGLIAPDPRRGGWLAGAAVAAGLSISLEQLPYATLFGGVFALRWLREARQGAAFTAFCGALALGSAVLFAATRLGDLSNRCDAVSPVWLVALAAMASVAWIAVWRAPKAALARAGALGLGAVLAVGLVWLIAPACAHGPFASLDPLVQRAWYDQVYEGRPVWFQPRAVAVRMVVVPMLGVAAAGWLWRHAADRCRPAWGEIALVLAGMLAIAIAVARASAVASALATVPTAAVLIPLARTIRRLQSPLLRLGAVAAVLVALVPGAAVAALERAIAAPKTPAPGAPARVDQACGQPGSLALLARLPAGDTAFAPIDLSPWVLVSTRLQVVATPHHRAARAIHDVIATFLADPAAARATVQAHGARWMISCADLAEAQIYAEDAPHGLMARLIAGHPPPWLEPVPLPSRAGTLRLWRVR